ncbi:dihydropteroate synthase [uncultured Prevotella sp.]|uniref:dihydropteroate synthase n=1 Tax=uncultured Prevotella sp. TaxID=159272 RepID=UPI002597150C|nr:dihydropteroate synthase [uncultured Prevotella sp.]
MNTEESYTINVHGRLLSLATPVVMGILNCTPDSFFAGSRKQTEAEIADRANQIISEGGGIIDVGAFSTGPGAQEVSEEEEMRRLRFAMPIVRREQPDAVVSVDTYRPNVAKMVVEEYGADIINDVSEGGITGIVDKPLEEKYDVQGDEEFKDYPAIFRMMGQLKVPYILMSVQGNLHDMVMGFSREVQQLCDLGVKDIILDPGYGFGKTMQVILDPGYGFGKTMQANFDILRDQQKLTVFGLPILAGLSRKRLIWKTLGTSADEALNGTTVVDTLALINGASILRVHDVREAVEVVKLVNCYK